MYVEINEVVPVDQPVAGADCLSPGQLRVAGLKLRRHSARGLTDDLHEPGQRQLKEAVVVEIVA
jgi:hypothetical protein